MTTEHLIRLGLIVLTCGGLGLAWIFGGLDPAQRAHVEGALIVLFPALVDAARVGGKQRAETKRRESLRPR